MVAPFSWAAWRIHCHRRTRSRFSRALVRRGELATICLDRVDRGGAVAVGSRASGKTIDDEA